ncbi:hypothetical protein AALA00_08845 [Lachnospiraceae bacterium 46-15]
MKKIKKNMGHFLAVFLFFMMGAGGGWLFSDYIGKAEEAGASVEEILFWGAVVLIVIYICVYLQIIIHEAGHLVFGLLTGYRFSSFRIGSFMWVKREDRIRFARYSLAGTGGQCLLSPPEMEDGRFPYVLYHMGGSLANLLSAFFAGGLAVLFHGMGAEAAEKLFEAAAVIGAVYAIMNGIPMRLGTIDNDGYHAYSAGKNPGALRANWLQLKVNEQIAAGVRLKDMPKEWFEMPSDEEMKNGMTAVIGVLVCNRLMDEKRFAEADREIERLLSMDTGIVGIHRNLMKGDQIFCELLGEERKEHIDRLRDKEQRKVAKAMKKFPSVLRTEYAYALLAEKDEDKARKIRDEFEKMAEKYPYPCDVESERELMEAADSYSRGH